MERDDILGGITMRHNNLMVISMRLVMISILTFIIAALIGGTIGGSITVLATMELFVSWMCYGIETFEIF
jgi:hypothetical protein